MKKAGDKLAYSSSASNYGPFSPKKSPEGVGQYS